MHGTGKYLMAFFLLALVSCGEEEVPDIAFHIRLGGFAMEQAEPGEWPAFTHRLDGGVVYFVTEDNYFEIDARKGIQDREFEVPAGDYGLVIKVSEASLYGQELAAFNILTHRVTIGPDTDTIEVEVEPACALVRVSDPRNSLSEEPYMIERHSYANGFFFSYPLTFDSLSGDYYAYFTPDPELEDPSAFLWFYEGMPGPEEGGIPTTGMEIGKQYRVNILQ